MGVSLLVQRHKSIDCKMMGKDIPCKQYPKENRSDSTNIRQNRLIKTKIVTRDQEEHYIMIKKSIHQ